MNARKADPYGAHRFEVRCDAIAATGFTAVQGLAERVVATDTHAPAHREQDLRAWHKATAESMNEIPTENRETCSPPLALTRGVTDDAALRNWLRDWVDGGIAPQDVRIWLLDSNGNPGRGWSCRRAIPVRWTGPDLVADRAAVAEETLELVHDGIDAVSDRSEDSE